MKVPSCICNGTSIIIRLSQFDFTLLDQCKDTIKILYCHVESRTFMVIKHVNGNFVLHVF